MKISAYILLVLLILMMGLSLQPAPTLPASGSPPVCEHRLPNGLTVILAEMHHSPIISFLIFYQVGSRNETSGKTGLSHLVEHMMFKGTSHFRPGEIARVLRQNYGLFNAYTTRDYTLYYEEMPRNTIEIAFRIEADRMQNCKFDPGEFHHELEVVKEERKIRIETNPQRLLEEQMMARLYRNHPYSWPITGWPEDLNRLTVQDARDFYRKFYRPNNAIIVLAGDFDSDQMLARIRHYFGTIPSGTPIPDLPDTFSFRPSSRKIIWRSPQVSQSKLLLYFPGAAYGSPDYPALKMALYLLRSPSSSPLYQRLLKNKLCQKIHLSMEQQIDPAPIKFVATLSPGVSPDTVRKIFLASIRSLRRGNISAKELRLMKNRFIVNRAYRNLKIFDVALRLGTNKVRTGNSQYDLLVRQRIHQLTPADIQRALQHYLLEDTMVEGLLLPGKDSAAAKPKHLPPPDLNGKMTPDISLRSHSPSVSYDSSRFLPLPSLAVNCDTFRLNNGIPVVFYPDYTVPIVEIRGIVRTGNTYADGFPKGTAAITCALLSKGSQHFPPSALRDTLAALASKIQFNSSEENLLFSWGTIQEQFEVLTRIGSDLLRHPLFPDSLFTRLRDEKISRLESIRRSTGWRISRYLMETIFRDHPYGQLPSPAHLRHLSPELVHQFYTRYCQPRNTTLVVTGNIERADLQKLLNRYLGDWRTTSSAPLTPFPRQLPVDTLQLVLFPAPADRQVTIRLAHEAPDRHSPDLENLMVANYILGGNSLTSRLGKTIRDNHGLVYGITSKLFARNHGGWWLVECKTSPGNAGRVLLLMLHEIEKMRRDGVSLEEVNEARGYFRGTMPFSMETPLDVLRILVEEIKLGFPLNHWDTFPDRLASINAESVSRTAQKYFHPRRSIIAIGGPVSPEELQTALQHAVEETGIPLPFPIDLNRVQVIETSE